MIRLYAGTGSQEVDLLGKPMSDAEWQVTCSSIVRLLQARRGGQRAAGLLATIPFELREGTNGFGDEFFVLYYCAPSDRYVELAESYEQDELKYVYQQIAEAVTDHGHYIRFIVLDLDTRSELVPVATPSLVLSSDSVERALADAEQLIHGRGPASGVDRVHTALHGYLKVVADNASVPYNNDADITTLFRLLRERHPRLKTPEPPASDIDRVFRSIATILHALNPLRNQASEAHPNEVILAEPEAMLVINSVRTLLHYVDAKLR